MNPNSQSSNDEILYLFNSESNKLQETVAQNLENYENLSISKIVELYYQVINVFSLAKFLKEKFKEIDSEDSNSEINNIKKVENLINGKFNENLHLLIMEKLKKSIESYKEKLKEISINHKEKTKENLEHQAKMYEELRQTMSTEEFVEQYNIGLSNSS